MLWPVLVAAVLYLISFLLRQRDARRRASEVVGRLRRAVEQPESGQGTQALELGDALRRAVYLLEPDAKRLGIVINLQSAEPVWVLADSVALEQIVHNLLMNAFQALQRSSTEPKRLQINTTQSGQFGELRVADNGAGIADEVLPRLFEPLLKLPH